MTDAVLSVRAGPEGEVRVGAVELDGRPLAQVLEDRSCKTLTQVAQAVHEGRPDPTEMPLVLFARDGRTLKADTAGTGGSLPGAWKLHRLAAGSTGRSCQPRSCTNR